MVRILHIVDSLQRSGTVQQMLLVAHSLAAKGYDVHVCALSELPKNASRIIRERIADERLAAANFSLSALGRRWPLDPLADWHLVRLVRRLQPDVVHTWDCVPGLFGPIAAGSAKPRLVAGIYRTERWPQAWGEFWQRRFAARVDRFVTNSGAVRDWCVRCGLPAEKFTVIPPGVSCAADEGQIASATGTASEFDAGTISGTHVRRDELLRDLQLPADARLIGVIGRLVPEKRVQDLIWAADLLRVLHNNLRLSVIGDGPLRRQLTRYARLASDLEHIQFLGERRDLRRIMPHLDVLWDSSENRGLSIAILEAMAAGVPVIASDTACNRELIVEGETGFMVPLNNRAGRATRARWTDRIFREPEFAARLGTASHRRAAEQFGGQRMVDLYVENYKQLNEATESSQ